MILEEIRSHCLSLPGVTESIKWEDHLCFCVAEKMFLIVNPDQFPISSSFKTSVNKFDELIANEGFIPAPYLARYKWVHVDNIERFSIKEWRDIIDMAYQLVFDKLPLKKRKELSGEEI